MDAYMATLFGGEAWDLYNIIAIDHSNLIIFIDSASPEFIKVNLR
jgi:hypothetical protein